MSCFDWLGWTCYSAGWTNTSNPKSNKKCQTCICKCFEMTWQMWKITHSLLTMISFCTHLNHLSCCRLGFQLPSLSYAKVEYHPHIAVVEIIFTHYWPRTRGENSINNLPWFFPFYRDPVHTSSMLSLFSSIWQQKMLKDSAKGDFFHQLSVWVINPKKMSQA